MNRIRLAIVDDHEMTRIAVIRLLSIEKEIEIVLEAENGIDLLEKLNQSIPDTILMDIQMPKMNGIEATEKVLSQYPRIKIIVLTQFDNEKNIIQMYSRGVKSFLAKHSDPSKLIKAIKVVQDGGAYITEEGLSIIKFQLQKYIGTKVHENNASFNSDQSKSFLTPQECKLVQLLKQGKTSKEIAVELKLTVNTVRTYRDRLLKKTNTRNVTELLNMCIQFE